MENLVFFFFAGLRIRFKAGGGGGAPPAGSLHEGLGCGLTELLPGSSGKPPPGEESKLAWSPGLLSTGGAICVAARGALRGALR